MSLLHEIFAHKRRELAARKAARPPASLERDLAAVAVPPAFIPALTAPHSPAPRLIAEVKHRSPSKGVLRPDFDPLALARTYAQHGAAAISVLTDEKYFGGSLTHLRDIAAIFQHSDNNPRSSAFIRVPILQKDFIFDRYQLLEARLNGASAALLIAAMLEQNTLRRLIQAAAELGLTPLVEVHTRAELERALNAGAAVIGINNRDLHTFTVDLRTTLELRPHIPPGVVVVSESGIRTRAHVRQLAAAGVDAMLVGESLVTAADVGKRLAGLIGPTGLSGLTCLTGPTNQTS